MSVWALGLNHTTAPLDLRGRFAFALDQIAPTLQSLRSSFGSGSHPQVEAAIISTCNRTEIYCASEHDRAGPYFRLAGPVRRRGPCPAALACLHPARRRSRPPRLPRGQRARLDGAGRSPDPGPDEGRRTRGRNRRRAGQHAQPAVPALVCRGQGSAHRHRDRRALDQHGRRGGPAGRAAVRRPAPDARAVRRRGRDDRPGRDALRGQGTRSPSPLPTARSSAAKSWPRASAAR
jgi:hypothetical protein